MHDDVCVTSLLKQPFNNEENNNCSKNTDALQMASFSAFTKTW